MDKIIDAHLHIDVRLENPVRQLLSEIDNEKINNGVLIVNTDEECRCILKEKELLISNSRIKLVAGLNIHSDNPYNILNSLSDFNSLCGIKLHPILYSYTKVDFEQILDSISRIEDNKQIKVIVIDTLFNNEHIENHVGIELGIIVAKKNPNRRIILAHTGSTRLLECCAFTRKIPNIFYDLSFVSTYFNHTSVRIDMINYLKYTSDRMMFGSDYPSFNIAGAKQALIEICEEAMLGEKQIDNVFSKTASKVYSIGENHL